MYINSTHIKIVKLIQHHKDITLNDISKALLLNDFTTRTYLKDIKIYISENRKNISFQDLFSEIYMNKKLIATLRKKQEFTKQEKIDYLIFNLLTKDIVNLSQISQEIQVNKRGLNYYFSEIKNILSSHKLIVKNNKQGIYIKGALNNKAYLQFIFTFKLFLDKYFLPRALKKDFFTYILKSDLRKTHNFKKFYPKMCKVLSPIVSRYTFKSFSSIYLSYQKISGNKIIKNLTEKELLKYKPSIFLTEDYFKIINLIKKTPLGELQSSNIDLLLLALRHFTYSYKKFSKHTMDLALIIRPIFEKYMKSSNFSNTDYFNCISPWIEFSFFRKAFNIFDYDYQIANLNIKNIFEIDSTIKEIQQIVPLFTKLDLIVSTYILHTKASQCKGKNQILVYDKIPEYIINIIVNELQVIHNIDILKAINIKNFYKNTDINSHSYSIITLENLNIKTDCEIRNYDLPYIRG